MRNFGCLVAHDANHSVYSPAQKWRVDQPGRCRWHQVSMTKRVQLSLQGRRGAVLHIRQKYPLASNCRYCFALAGSYLIAAICAWARRATTWQTLLPIIWALAVVNRLGPARATPQMGARKCQMACACVLVTGDSTDNCCRIIMNLLGSNFTSAGLPFSSCELCSKPRTNIVRCVPKESAIVNAGFVVKSCTGRTSLPCTGHPVLGCGGLSPARLPA